MSRLDYAAYFADEEEHPAEQERKGDDIRSKISGLVDGIVILEHQEPPCLAPSVFSGI